MGWRSSLGIQADFLVKVTLDCDGKALSVLGLFPQGPTASRPNHGLAGEGLYFQGIATSSSSWALDPSTVFLLTTKGGSSSKILTSKADHKAYKEESHVCTAPF